MKYISYLFFFSLLFASCVTGNDNNAVLADLEEQFAQTPRVTNLTVNGAAPTRNTESQWIPFTVKAGDQVVIAATFETGNGAASSTFDFSRTFHATTYDADSAKPVEPMTTREMTFGSGANEFSFTYTVPANDDDGDAFHSGDHINLTIWSSNDLGGQGFTDINLEFE
jgi:hypothetical protein